MRRRDFLRGRPPADPARLDLSCERLYVELVGARGEPAARAFLERLDQRLARAHELRLRDVAWLAREELRAALEPRLAAFRARGGRVEPTTLSAGR